MSAPDNTRKAWIVHKTDLRWDDVGDGEMPRGFVRVVSLDAVLDALRKRAEEIPIPWSDEASALGDAAEFLESVFGAEDPQP